MEPFLISDFIQKLEHSRIKLTRQRRLIIEKMGRFEKAFCAEDLYLNGLKRAKIDLATIYRTLNLFAEKNWISPIHASGGHTRYVMKPAASHLHTLLCKSCHRVEHLNGCFVEQQQEELTLKGFTSLTHKVEFVGLCPACNLKQGPPK